MVMCVALATAGMGAMGPAIPVSAQAAPAATAQQQSLFAITYRAGPAWKPGVRMEEQGLRDHFFYVKDLHEKGRIVLAGPMGAEGGLILLRARDQADADAVMAADPAVIAGIFAGQALPFIARFTAP